MSESIWCNVRIVTPLSWGDNADLIPGVQMVSDGLINGEGAWFEAHETAPTDRRVWEMTGEGNYGLSDDEVAAGLAWCREHGVPFRAVSDAKYEMEGEIEVFDGVSSHERSGDGDGCVVMGQHTFEQLAGAHELPADGLAAVRSYFVLPVVEEVSIAHLPVELPVSVDA